MNEYETNPQRHEASSPEEPSHRTADTPREHTDPERGQSDTTAPFAPSTAYQGSPWQADQQPYAAPQQSHPAQPAYGAPQPYPAQQPYGAPQPYPGQQHYPGQQYPGQPGYDGGYPGPSGTGQQPQPGQEGHTAQLPSWAQPVGGPPPHDPARTGRGRRMLATGAAAVLLALAAGGVGAYGALAFADDGTVATTRTSNSAVTRVVDRSSLAEIASSVKNSVVSITTGSGEGSGVVLTADGFVVTNNHVVASAEGQTVKVVFADGKSANARIVGRDPRTDLAVVKAEGVSGLEAAKFGSSANMQVGDTVLAVGSPLGLEGSVTAGIISAKDRTIRAGDSQEQPNPFGGQQQAPTSMSGLLQTDTAINPGNSGGALVNTNGEVIGINSAIATSGQNSGNIGLGFAIPSDKANAVANQLMRGEKVSHPALGVTVTEGQSGGAVVSTVAPNSAAAKAGLRQGDVISKVNGVAINDSDDLVAVVQQGKVGQTVQVTFTRNGAQQTVNATLTEAS